MTVSLLNRVTLDETDYQESKEDTMEQLREFNESLQRMISGDMTLVNELGAMQLVRITHFLYLNTCNVLYACVIYIFYFS